MPAPEPNAVQLKDAHHARLASEFLADASAPRVLRDLADDPRVTIRRSGSPDPKGRCVVYWMQRSQRGRDNHALDKAVHVANALGLPVVAYFAGIKNFPHANLRHYAFLNQGLPDIAADCAARNVTFVLRRAIPERPGNEDHEHFFADVHAAIVLADENPMRVPEQWRDHLAKTLRIPFWTIDADVIVPSKLLEKAQFSAGVARPRLYRALKEFLVPYENPHAQHAWKQPRNFQHDDPHKDITASWQDFDRTVLPVDAWQGGHHAALKRLHHFATNLLPIYERDHNHPELDGSSKLSPYLHFGHISPLTIALAIEAEVKNHPHLKPARDSYFNELIAWRELAINFVRYQPDYDNSACADNWARLTIAEHDRDQREVLYKLPALEQARTHDDLWNAAQLQMLHHGWMHNYLRMYWAKKILEWTPNVRTAMRVAVYLNDKYFLDGRDPNGYAGIAWSMLGKFDRAWGSRSVYGKRRSMSAASTGKKFNSKLYIAQMQALPNALPK